MVLEEFYIPMDRNETWPLPYTIHKNYFKMVIDLNRKKKTIQLLEENEEYLHNFRGGKDYSLEEVVVKDEWIGLHQN